MLRRLASAQTLGAIPPPPESFEAEAKFFDPSQRKLVGKFRQWFGFTPAPEIKTFEPGAFLGRVDSVGENNEAFFRDSSGQTVPAMRGQHLLQWDPDARNYRVYERKAVKRPETFWDSPQWRI